jgi:class 3 adenylate cyclase
LGLGVTIGLAGALTLTLGDRQSSFLAQLLDLSSSVLVFVAAGCAFVGGALLRRAAVTREKSDRAESELLQLHTGVASGEVMSRQRDQAREHASYDS